MWRVVKGLVICLLTAQHETEASLIPSSPSRHQAVLPPFESKRLSALPGFNRFSHRREAKKSRTRSYQVTSGALGGVHDTIHTQLEEPGSDRDVTQHSPLRPLARNAQAYYQIHALNDARSEPETLRRKKPRHVIVPRDQANQFYIARGSDWDVNPYKLPKNLYRLQKRRCLHSKGTSHKKIRSINENKGLQAHQTEPEHQSSEPHIPDPSELLEGRGSFTLVPFEKALKLIDQSNSQRSRPFDVVFIPPETLKTFRSKQEADFYNGKFQSHSEPRSHFSKQHYKGILPQVINGVHSNRGELTTASYEAPLQTETGFVPMIDSYSNKPYQRKVIKYPSLNFQYGQTHSPASFLLTMSQNYGKTSDDDYGDETYSQFPSEDYSHTRSQKSMESESGFLGELSPQLQPKSFKLPEPQQYFTSDDGMDYFPGDSSSQLSTSAAPPLKTKSRFSSSVPDALRSDQLLQMTETATPSTSTPASGSQLQQTGLNQSPASPTNHLPFFHANKDPEHAPQLQQTGQIPPPAPKYSSKTVVINPSYPRQTVRQGLAGAYERGENATADDSYRTASPLFRQSSSETNITPTDAPVPFLYLRDALSHQAEAGRGITASSASPPQSQNDPPPSLVLVPAHGSNILSSKAKADPDVSKLATTLESPLSAQPGGPLPSPSSQSPTKGDAARYEFRYGVRNIDGNNFGHRESRFDDRVTGEYYVLLPDARTQTVNYHVEGAKGYVARVQYQGDAQTPSANRI